MRTEEEVLKDFEKLGYRVFENNKSFCKLKKYDEILCISKIEKWYGLYGEKGELRIPTYIQEHKLLNELFQIWKWL